LHKNNKHSKGYDFNLLVKKSTELEAFVFINAFGNETIDFANPKAVKLLNTALLKHYYNIQFWEFPETHLCPPIPGRVQYIHVLNDLLLNSKQQNNTVLDLGTGATCIYPLLGHAEYGWTFIASEIDMKAIKSSEKIITQNKLSGSITIRHQDHQHNILTGILKPNEKVSAVMCNPPFYKNEAEAIENTERKLKGLGQNTDKLIRNFSGTAKELWYPGGEKAFLHNYLYQSSLFKTNCFWYTSLVSKKDLVKSMQSSLKKLGATEIRVLHMSLGNKISRVVAWTFLTDKQQQDWHL